jgi:hypothetical protein
MREILQKSHFLIPSDLTTEDTESTEEEELVCCHENHRFDSRGEFRSRFEKTLTSKLAISFTKHTLSLATQSQPFVFSL